MEKISHFSRMRVCSDLNEDLGPWQGGTFTIGKYDGLHLGHQELLRRLQKGPKPGIVLTFDPHPLQVLQPELGLTKIFPKSDLVEQLPCYGVDLLTILPFSKELAALSATEFAERYIGRFNPRQIVVGYDFAFGRGREGNLQWMREWCRARKITLTEIAPLEIGGAIVSSGRVRDRIRQGDMNEVRSLLARPFYVRGKVVRGAGRGRTIGFPTLNLAVENETIPGMGVYATRTKINHLVYPSVTNVGLVPTFGAQNGVQVETHLIGTVKDAYGERVDVEFIKKLRPEKKFPSADDLKKQIEQDILEAKRELDAYEKMDVHKSHQ